MNLLLFWSNLPTVLKGIIIATFLGAAIWAWGRYLRHIPGLARLRGFVRPVLVIVGLILIGLWLTRFDWQTLAADQQTQQTRAAKLTAVNQAQKDAIKDIFLRFPLQSVDPWRLSPTEVNLTFDRSRPGMQYVMNLTYMKTLTSKITFGRRNISTVEGRAGEGPQWLYVRGDASDEEAPLNDSANYFHVRAVPDWRYGRDESPLIGLHFTAAAPSDAVVIRTEKLVRSGEAVHWGPVWTKLGDRPLKIEMKIIILDRHGNPFQPNHFTETLPYVWFTDDSAFSRGDPANAVYCSGTFTEFTEKSPHLADTNGKLLSIWLPRDFGDARVLVNLRIR